MIKKSKKCLALILSVASVSSFMGNFGAIAMNPSPAAAAAASAPRGSAWSNPLALQALRHQGCTGITEEDLEIPEVRMVFEVCERLRSHPLKRLEHGEKEEVELLKKGEECKSSSELCDLHVKYSLDTGKGTDMTFALRVIYEVFKEFERQGKYIKIYPLLLKFENGFVERTCVFMVLGKKYVIDPELLLSPPVSDVSCIFTMQAYLEFRKFMSEKDPVMKVNSCTVTTEDIITFDKPLSEARVVYLSPETGVEIPCPIEAIMRQIEEMDLLDRCPFDKYGFDY